MFRERTQLYIKLGKGFHSNDARVILANSREKVLPAAFGVDLGANLKPLPGVLINVAAWYLFLEQELIYVGDEGIVEASGKTKRIGIDFSTRFQINRWLVSDFNISIAKPRNIQAPKGEEFIPLAPTLTGTGGLSWQTKKGITGSLRYRHMKNRAANESNTTIAKGYTIVDLSVNYTRKKYEIGMTIENLFNSKWNETQFETKSRLRNEMNSVTEIHFTPGIPIFAKLKIALFF